MGDTVAKKSLFHMDNLSHPDRRQYKYFYVVVHHPATLQPAVHRFPTCVSLSRSPKHPTQGYNEILGLHCHSRSTLIITLGRSHWAGRPPESWWKRFMNAMKMVTSVTRRDILARNCRVRVACSKLFLNTRGLSTVVCGDQSSGSWFEGVRLDVATSLSRLWNNTNQAHD
jgi:hypothetical protein